MASSIGSFDFRALHGQPEEIKEQVEVLARAGVPGVAIVKTGQRGRQFTVRSVTGVADTIEGRNFYYDYTLLIGQDPQPIVWGGMTLGYRVAVIDVRQTALRTVLCDTHGAGAILECEWDLIPIAEDVEE
jgi:hypothetical protein